MADGSSKLVENIVQDDEVLVHVHFTKDTFAKIVAVIKTRIIAIIIIKCHSLML